MVKTSGKQVSTSRIASYNFKPRLNDGHGKARNAGKKCNHPNCELNGGAEDERKSPHYRKR